MAAKAIGLLDDVQHVERAISFLKDQHLVEKHDTNIIYFSKNSIRTNLRQALNVMKMIMASLFSRDKIILLGISTFSIKQMSTFFLLILLASNQILGNATHISKNGINFIQIFIFSPFHIFLIPVRFVGISKMYFRIFIKKVNGYFIGFNKIHGPHNLWYVRFGDQLLRYGVFGYSPELDFGESLRDNVFSPIFSYGYLPKKVGMRSYYLICTLSCYASCLVVGFLSGNYLMVILSLFLVPLSPYFVYPNIMITRPQNLGWFLVILSIGFYSAGYLWVASVCVLAISYISLTPLFVASIYLMIQILLNESIGNVWILIPGTIKIILDLSLISDLMNFKNKLSVLKKPKKNKIKRNIATRQSHLLIIVVSACLGSVGYVTHHPMYALFFLNMILIWINFKIVRIADLDTFYRMHFCACILFSAFAGGLTETLLPLVVLIVNPALVNDLKYLIGNDDYMVSTKTVAISKKTESIIFNFFDKIESNARVLIAYESDVPDSNYRYLGFIFYYYGQDRKLSLVPSWGTVKKLPVLNRKLIEIRKKNVEIKQVETLMEAIGSTYIIALPNALQEIDKTCNFSKINSINIDEFKSICHFDKEVKGEVVLYKMESNSGICPGSQIEVHPNIITIKGVTKDYTVVKYACNSKWEARQNNKKCNVISDDICGIKFMKIKNINNSDIIMNYGKNV